MEDAQEQLNEIYHSDEEELPDQQPDEPAGNVNASDDSLNKNGVPFNFEDLTNQETENWNNTVDEDQSDSLSQEMHISRPLSFNFEQERKEVEEMTREVEEAVSSSSIQISGHVLNEDNSRDIESDGNF